MLSGVLEVVNLQRKFIKRLFKSVTHGVLPCGAEQLIECNGKKGIENQ